MDVVLEPLDHLGHLEEDEKHHILHRMTHHDDLLVYSLLQPWSHPWKRLLLELMDLHFLLPPLLAGFIQWQCSS